MACCGPNHNPELGCWCAVCHSRVHRADFISIICPPITSAGNEHPMCPSAAHIQHPSNPGHFPKAAHHSHVQLKIGEIWGFDSTGRSTSAFLPAIHFSLFYYARRVANLHVSFFMRRSASNFYSVLRLWCITLGSHRGSGIWNKFSLVWVPQPHIVVELRACAGP